MSTSVIRPMKRCPSCTSSICNMNIFLYITMCQLIWIMPLMHYLCETCQRTSWRRAQTGEWKQHCEILSLELLCMIQKLHLSRSRSIWPMQHLQMEVLSPSIFLKGTSKQGFSKEWPSFCGSEDLMTWAKCLHSAKISNAYLEPVTVAVVGFSIISLIFKVLSPCWR